MVKDSRGNIISNGLRRFVFQWIEGISGHKIGKESLLFFAILLKCLFGIVKKL